MSQTVRRASKILLLNRERCNVAEIAAGLRISERYVCAVLERFAIESRIGSAGLVVNGSAAMRAPDDGLALLSVMLGEWPPVGHLRGCL